MKTIHAILLGLTLLATHAISAQGRRGIETVYSQVNQNFGPFNNLKVKRTLKLGRHQGKTLEFVDLQVEKVRPMHRRQGRRHGPGMRGPVTATLVINGRPTGNSQLIRGRQGLNSIRFTLHRRHKVLGQDIQTVQVQFDKPVFVYDTSAGVGRMRSIGRLIDQKVRYQIIGRQRLPITHLIQTDHRVLHRRVQSVTIIVRNHSMNGAIKLCKTFARGAECQKQRLSQGRNELRFGGQGIKLQDLELVGRGDMVIKRIKIQVGGRGHRGGPRRL